MNKEVFNNHVKETKDLENEIRHVKETKDLENEIRQKAIEFSELVGKWSFMAEKSSTELCEFADKIRDEFKKNGGEQPSQEDKETLRSLSLMHASSLIALYPFIELAFSFSHEMFFKDIDDTTGAICSTQPEDKHPNVLKIMSFDVEDHVKERIDLYRKALKYRDI